MANFCWSFASLLMALTTLVALVAFMKEPDVFRGPGHHDHRPSRDQLASAASTTSVQQQQQHCSSIAANQVSTCETTNSVDQGSEQWQQQHKQQVVSTTRQDRHHRSSHKLLLENLSSSSSSRRTRQKDSNLLKYRLPPRRSVTVFETDRLVPTGPNPFHNSNSTQVWYP
ncbi:unnamed protein product [Sphagnum jensenii]